MMKQYDSYKDSGIEWIGKIPSHWEVSCFKDFASLRTDASDDDNKIGLENIEGKTGRFIETSTEFEGNGTAFQEGDIVYGKLRPYLQKVWLATFDGNAVGDFFVFRAKENCRNRLLFYIMISDGFTCMCNGATFGAKMPRVSSDFIRGMHFYLPPIIEQDAIINYLDAKCGKIDKAIATQEKRVELLKELRQNIITQAVTRGINPDAPLKDSGVEWIGEVPEHWEVRKLKTLLSIPLQYGANESAEDQDDSFPRYIRITDISEDGKLKDETWKSLNPEKAKDYLLKRGDVLFARSGATVGKTYKFDEDYSACYAGYLIKATCNKQLCPDYLLFYTQSGLYDNWKNSIFIQSTIQNIGADKYSYLPIVLPPLPEQQEIVSYIESQTVRLDKSIEKAEHQIELLQELKQSIITEVVTGKRKVV